ncbi:MAG: ferrochelatase [Fibrobacteres bacterium]|nr:ferrochelatase [Fibrobacterota bacterium]
MFRDLVHPEMKTAVLVLNLGSPDSPAPGKVRRYLREFLSDPRVIDINAAGRWALLNLFILPFRPRKSGEAYAKIWSPAGSPLVDHTRAFTAKLKARLPQDWDVDFAMRYGNPSIASRLEGLLAKSPERLILFPMYPQYASSSTGSTLEKVFSLLGKRWNVPSVSVVPPFFSHAGFLEACAAQGRPLLESFKPDHILFSYHGLPERQIRKSESLAGHCLQADDGCCASYSWKNNFCYRAQCFETTRRLAAILGLAPSRYSIGFQSRLGRTPWIKPYTDLLVTDIAKQGKKRLLVFEPSFTADCLETLEEIAIRAQATFLESGGERLMLVPAVNSSDAWADAAADLVTQA